jgi:hypothetical protein
MYGSVGWTFVDKQAAYHIAGRNCNSLTFLDNYFKVTVAVRRKRSTAETKEQNERGVYKLQKGFAPRYLDAASHAGQRLT